LITFCLLTSVGWIFLCVFACPGWAFSAPPFLTFSPGGKGFDGESARCSSALPCLNFPIFLLFLNRRCAPLLPDPYMMASSAPCALLPKSCKRAHGLGCPPPALFHPPFLYPTASQGDAGGVRWRSHWLCSSTPVLHRSAFPSVF